MHTNVHATINEYVFDKRIPERCSSVAERNVSRNCVRKISFLQRNESFETASERSRRVHHTKRKFLRLQMRMTKFCDISFTTAWKTLQWFSGALSNRVIFQIKVVAVDHRQFLQLKFRTTLRNWHIKYKLTMFDKLLRVSSKLEPVAIEHPWGLRFTRSSFFDILLLLQRHEVSVNFCVTI